MPDGLTSPGDIKKSDDVKKLDRDPPAFENAMKTERDAKTDDDVRQGATGQGVRYVLAASLGGALIALFVLYSYFTPG